LALLAVLAVLLYPAAITRRQSLPLPLVLPGAVFVLALLLSTTFSANPRLSIWGSYARQQGLITLVAYVALAATVATAARAWPQARRLLLVLVWASAPVVVYGLLQALHLDPVAWQSDGASPVLSTVGRSNFLGSYLVLVVPLTLVVTRLARRWLLYIPLVLAQLTVLGLTRARGAWLGLGVGLVAGGLA
jgi:hypothetical protein